MKKENTLSLVHIAIGAGLIVSLSQITLPIGPVPFTLQTLAIGLLATLYKPKEAISSVLIYLLLGAIGLPVFAGFTGGFQALVGPTAGFLWGFVLYTAITSILTEYNSSPFVVMGANILGDFACFVVGILVFRLITGSSWTDTLTWTTIPFLLPEAFKIATTVFAHKALYPILKKHPYFTQK